MAEQRSCIHPTGCAETQTGEHNPNADECAWIWDVVNRMDTQLQGGDQDDERAWKNELAMEAAPENY